MYFHRKAHTFFHSSQQTTHRGHNKVFQQLNLRSVEEKIIRRWQFTICYLQTRFLVSTNFTKRYYCIFNGLICLENVFNKLEEGNLQKQPMFFKIGARQNLTKFTRKYLFQILFLTKLQTLHLKLC